MSNFELVKDLRIGHIVEVSGTSIRVELDGDVTDLSRTHAGRVYPIGQMGSIVKMGCCRNRGHRPKRITLPRTLQD